jgi:hypothetical protein
LQELDEIGIELEDWTWKMDENGPFATWTYIFPTILFLKGGNWGVFF